MTRAPRGHEPGQALPDPGGAADRAHGRRDRRRQRDQLRDRGGGDARPGRRVGLRQVDRRLLRAPAAEADVRLGALRGNRADRARPRGAAQDAARDADRLPGPVLVARPADDRRRHRRRAADRARDRHAQGPGDSDPRAARRRRVQPELHEPLSARVLGRPAPADRDRPRARSLAEADRVRRAGLGARRVDPGSDPQPAQGPAAGLRPHVSLHRPRSRGRALDERPDRGDEQGPARRGRPRGAGLHEPAGRLHEGAALGGADPGSPRDEGAQGRRAAKLRHALAPRG